MIAAPRVLFVTRRFWPLANDNMWRILHLAGALQHAGWQPQIVTAQWHSAWPEQVEVRDLRITRLAPSPTTPFRLKRYTRAVCDWVSQHSATIDCAIVDAMEEEAVSLTAGPIAELVPIIVRYDTAASGGPLMGRIHQHIVTACRQAAHVVVPHEHARRELVAAGIAIGKISLVPDGPAQRIERGDTPRALARRALAEINYELFLRAEDRLCICPCEMNKQAGMDLLIRTLGPLIETQRNVRCWIIGDGPERARLVEMLRREGWKSDILMPGTFEDLDVVMAAADLCILPGAAQGLSWLLPTAVTSGLTTLVCDSPAARSRLGGAANPLLFEQGNTQQLREKVQSWLERPKSWQPTTNEAAQHFHATCSSTAIERWRELINQFEQVKKSSGH